MKIDLLFPFKWIIFPYRYGDPSLGTGETREQNRAILNKRWDEAEPKFRRDQQMKKRTIKLIAFWNSVFLLLLNAAILILLLNQ